MPKYLHAQPKTSKHLAIRAGSTRRFITPNSIMKADLSICSKRFSDSLKALIEDTLGLEGHGSVMYAILSLSCASELTNKPTLKIELA
jgi:hypothetical protein